nr:hypothetical protein DBT45_08485 [Aerococcus tenax]
MNDYWIEVTDSAQVERFLDDSALNKMSSLSSPKNQKARFPRNQSLLRTLLLCYYSHFFNPYHMWCG